MSSAFPIPPSNWTPQSYTPQTIRGHKKCWDGHAAVPAFRCLSLDGARAVDRLGGVARTSRPEAVQDVAHTVGRDDRHTAVVLHGGVARDRRVLQADGTAVAGQADVVLDGVSNTAVATDGDITVVGCTGDRHGAADRRRPDDDREVTRAAAAGSASERSGVHGAHVAVDLRAEDDQATSGLHGDVAVDRLTTDGADRAGRDIDV